MMLKAEKEASSLAWSSARAPKGTPHDVQGMKSGRVKRLRFSVASGRIHAAEGAELSIGRVIHLGLGAGPAEARRNAPARTGALCGCGISTRQG